MPPTTGGSTNGSRTSERTTRWPGNVVLASTMAIGTPTITQAVVEAVDVCRLSFRAARDDSDVIREKKSDHSTRAAIATSGSTTNRPPTSAGTYSQRGRPEYIPARRIVLRLGEAGGGQDVLAVGPGDQTDELLGQLLVLAAGQRGDRVGVHGLAGLRKRDPVDLVAGGLDVGHIDHAGVGLAAGDLAQYVGDG